MDIRDRVANTVEVECWCCKYHENYPMNCYKEPIRTPLCLHRYELADIIIPLVRADMQREIGVMLYKMWKDEAFMNMQRMEDCQFVIPHKIIKALKSGTFKEIKDGKE